MKRFLFNILILFYISCLYSHSIYSYVANPHICRACHTEQVEFWEQTKHASAYLVLFSKDMHFDPSCIVCHTIGYGEKGGFNRITQPVSLSSPDIRVLEPLWIEAFMRDVFHLKKDDEVVPFDSRVEPERFNNLKQTFLTKIHTLYEEGRVKNNYLGVSCEHCHGDRTAHITNPTQTKKNIKHGNHGQQICTTCHRPPHQDDFSYQAMIGKVSCPKIKKF